MCLFYILSSFYFSQELCWRLTTRMIAVFIIMYWITNMVFSLPNLFQLCSQWRHHSCQMAIMSALCSFTLELSTASILLTPVTKQEKKNRQKETKERIWDHRTGKTNQGKENSQVLSKPARAPVHCHFMGRPLRQSNLLGFRGRSCPSLSPLPSLLGTPKKQAQPQSPQELVKELEDNLALTTCCAGASLKCLWVSGSFYFYIFAEYVTLLIFSQI